MTTIEKAKALLEGKNCMNCIHLDLDPTRRMTCLLKKKKYRQKTDICSKWQHVVNIERVPAGTRYYLLDKSNNHYIVEKTPDGWKRVFE